VNLDDFLDRFAMCPLYRRDNVRIRYNMGNVVLDEHPIGIVVGAHLAPVDPSARYKPCETETTYARIRCPAALAPLMSLEGS
jgi:hypothetical protein